MSNQKLAPTAVASTAVGFVVSGDDKVSVSVSGLGAGQSIALEQLQGGSWAAITQMEGGVSVTVELTAERNLITIEAQGSYRLNKPDTTPNAVGIYINESNTQYG